VAKCASTCLSPPHDVVESGQVCFHLSESSSRRCEEWPSVLPPVCVFLTTLWRVAKCASTCLSPPHDVVKSGQVCFHLSASSSSRRCEARCASTCLSPPHDVVKSGQVCFHLSESSSRRCEARCAPTCLRSPPHDVVKSGQVCLHEVSSRARLGVVQ